LRIKYINTYIFKTIRQIFDSEKGLLNLYTLVTDHVIIDVDIDINVDLSLKEEH